jgi:Uma2 family endonuclease
MMTATLPPPKVVKATPRPKHWTCDEFHRFGDLGAFEGRRAMLIDGEILEEGPMNPPHAMVQQLVEAAIKQAFGSGWSTRGQLPLVLAQWTDPHPDVAVVPGDPRDYVSHPTTASLVVEISDTTFDFDTDEKRLLYAAAGIPEYWVVDVNGRRLLVYRNPVNGDYPAPQVLVQTDVVTPLAASTTVRVADLLA